MFWIPVMFIAACVLLVRYLVHSGQEAVAKSKHDAWKRSYESFCSSVEPDRELKYRVDRECESSEVRAKIVQEFMGDNNNDWRLFSMHKPEAARMVVLAKLGKLESPVFGFRIPSYFESASKSSKFNIEPPWRNFEMTEKFLLKIEEELSKHGVEAKLVANYGNSTSGNYVYYPVREYVWKYGYGREDYINFSTEFHWEPCLQSKVRPVP